MTRPGYALFARMQSISPAYSTWCDAAPPILRTCEPHASTDTFLSRDSALARTHTGIPVPGTWYVITGPLAQAVSTAAAVQTSEIFGVVAVFEALHSLTYSLLHDESSFCNTGACIRVCVAVKRCRYHAIRGSVVMYTWHVSYEYGRYRTPYTT